MAGCQSSFSFLEDKLQGQGWLMRVTPAPVSDYLFPDSPFSFRGVFLQPLFFYHRKDSDALTFEREQLSHDRYEKRSAKDAHLAERR